MQGAHLPVAAGGFGDSNLQKHYAWFDKLTMREKVRCNANREHCRNNSLQSTLSLMVSFLSLSKGEPRTGLTAL